MSGDASATPVRQIRILDFWKENEVWFLDWVHRDRPWGDEKLLEAIPPEAAGHFGVKVGEYVKVDGQGYEPGQIVIVKSRDELRQLVEGMKKVEGLLFPWFDRIVVPGLWLPHFQTIDGPRYRSLHAKRFVKALGITIVLAVIGFRFEQFFLLSLVAAAYFGLFPLVNSAFAWARRVERLSINDLNSRLVNDQFFQIWLFQRPTLVLKVALGILIAIFVLQIWSEGEGVSSLERAALVRDAVLNDGEWWRIVTAGLMHGDLLHILFNGMALFGLGRVIVALVSPALLSVVFLLSVFTGSLASLWLGSAMGSVGASGGILGLLGFLLVVCHNFRNQLPDYLQSNLIQSTIVVALFGLLGSRFIDNAGHGGGLIGGVVFGILCLPWMRLAPVKTSPLVATAGWISIAILLAGVVKVVVEIWPS